MSTHMGARGYQLLRQVAFCDISTLPSYDDDGIRHLVDELQEHLDLVAAVVQKAREEDGVPDDEEPDLQQEKHRAKTASVLANLDAILRIKRCLLIYHNERLKRIADLRWQGKGLPADIQQKLSPAEQEFFKTYDRAIAQYQNAVKVGDLCTDMKPPKRTLITVMATEDLGEIFFGFPGEFVKMEAGSMHLVSSEEAEPLIRQKKLKVVDDKQRTGNV